MVRKLQSVFTILLFSLTILRAQNISVSATTDTSTYKVGDYIKYQIEIKHDKLIAVNMPSVKDSIKVLEYIQTLPSEKIEVYNQVIERYNYIFSKYDSANITIPAITLEYIFGRTIEKKLIKTNPVTITVRTLPVNAQEDIRDVKDPLKLPLNWLLISAIVVIIFLLIGLLYYLYQRYKKKKALKENILPEIKIPPHEIALTHLHELEQKKLWQNGFVKQFHSEVTEIVRQYFEERFNFRALEMTSAEILAVLSYMEEGKKIVQTSDNFFSNADLVKFAKFEPMPKVNDEMMNQAYEIVNQTIPAPPQNVSEDKNVQ
ncbi:MAG: BatD family protein [Melioribacteraceae bacterium]